jgi:uncharacterized membrane-anchored protein YjiN (DUF445 family)
MNKTVTLTEIAHNCLLTAQRMQELSERINACIEIVQKIENIESEQMQSIISNINESDNSLRCAIAELIDKVAEELFEHAQTTCVNYHTQSE